MASRGWPFRSISAATFRQTLSASSSGRVGVDPEPSGVFGPAWNDTVASVSVTQPACGARPTSSNHSQVR
jgi:hypothetical protein